MIQKGGKDIIVGRGPYEHIIINEKYGHERIGPKMVQKDGNDIIVGRGPYKPQCSHKRLQEKDSLLCNDRQSIHFPNRQKCSQSIYYTLFSLPCFFFVYIP